MSAELKVIDTMNDTTTAENRGLHLSLSSSCFHMPPNRWCLMENPRLVIIMIDYLHS